MVETVYKAGGHIFDTMLQAQVCEVLETLLAFKASPAGDRYNITLIVADALPALAAVPHATVPVASPTEPVPTTTIYWSKDSWQEWVHFYCGVSPLPDETRKAYRARVIKLHPEWKDQEWLNSWDPYPCWNRPDGKPQ